MTVELFQHICGDNIPPKFIIQAHYLLYNIVYMSIYQVNTKKDKVV